MEHCWVSMILSETIEVHGYLLLWNIAPSCYAFELICLLFIVFYYFLLLSGYQSSIFAAEILFIFSQQMSSSQSLCPFYLSTSVSILAVVLKVGFIDPVKHWSPRSFHGVCKVNTIFIVIVRHYLLFQYTAICSNSTEAKVGVHAGILHQPVDHHRTLLTFTIVLAALTIKNKKQTH